MAKGEFQQFKIDTRADFDRVHKRIDDVYEKIDDIKLAQADINTNLARITTRLELWPSFPKRPCPDHAQIRKEFDQHIEASVEIKRSFMDAAISHGIDLMKIVAVFVGGILWQKYHS